MVFQLHSTVWYYQKASNDWHINALMFTKLSKPDAHHSHVNWVDSNEDDLPLSLSLQLLISLLFESPLAHLHIVGMLQFMSDKNQPSLPTPFYSVLKSVSVFMALSTVFLSINSPYNSVFSLCSSGLISALLVLWAIYLLMKVSFSPDIIHSGWVGSCN